MRVIYVMMNEMRKLLLLSIFILASIGLQAQYAKDSVSKWDYHLTVGTGVVSDFDNQVKGYYMIAPEIEYNPNSRWSIKAGFNAISDMDSYVFKGREPRSLAPRKNSSTAVGVHLSAQYQVNDRLWLGATVFHIGGQSSLMYTFNPYYGWQFGAPVDLGITGMSADMRYRIGDSSYLDLHISVMRDQYGTLPILYDNLYLNTYRIGTGFGPFNMEWYY